MAFDLFVQHSTRDRRRLEASGPDPSANLLIFSFNPRLREAGDADEFKVLAKREQKQDQILPEHYSGHICTGAPLCWRSR